MLGLTQAQLRSLARLRGQVAQCAGCGRNIPASAASDGEWCPKCWPYWPADVPDTRDAKDWDRTSVLC